MLPSFIISLLVALSATAWVYDKTNRRTGGNTQNSIKVAVIAGVFAFIIIMTVLNLIDRMLNQ